MNSFKTYLPFVAAMTLVVVASNILVQYPFNHFGMQDVLTWGRIHLSDCLPGQ